MSPWERVDVFAKLSHDATHNNAAWMYTMLLIRDVLCFLVQRVVGRRAHAVGWTTKRCSTTKCRHAHSFQLFISHYQRPRLDRKHYRKLRPTESAKRTRPSHNWHRLVWFTFVCAEINTFRNLFANWWWWWWWWWWLHETHMCTSNLVYILQDVVVNYMSYTIENGDVLTNGYF